MPSQAKGSKPSPTRTSSGSDAETSPSTTTPTFRRRLGGKPSVAQTLPNRGRQRRWSPLIIDADGDHRPLNALLGAAANLPAPGDRRVPEPLRPNPNVDLVLEPRQHVVLRLHPPPRIVPPALE